MQFSSQTDWTSGPEEGQLAVDVYRDGDVLVIRSLVAGVNPDDLDVSVNGDLLTIRGKRYTDRETEANDWFHQECYWGSFSRSIVLPYHVAADMTEAQLKNGLLEVRIPIRNDGQQVKVKWG